MKPLALFINLAGPIDHPEHGKCHQVEFGITTKDSKKPDHTRMIVPTANTSEAVGLIMPMVQAFLSSKYPQPKTPVPANVTKLHD